MVVYCADTGNGKALGSKPALLPSEPLMAGEGRRPTSIFTDGFAGLQNPFAQKQLPSHVVHQYPSVQLPYVLHIENLG